MKAWPSVIGLASAMLFGGCAHHDRKDLIHTANVSLIEAVKNAEVSIPDGRTVEAELEREEGRTVYEVEMIDSKQNLRKVYVDATSGKVIRIH